MQQNQHKQSALIVNKTFIIIIWQTRRTSSRGLVDKALELKPEVVGSNPGSGRRSTTAPWALHSRLPTAPSVCTWMG